MNRISEVMKDFLKEEELEVFTGDMEQFSYLEPDEEVLTVVNPVGLENLYIQTCSTGAILSFGNWQQEYSDDDGDIRQLKEDVDDILHDRTYVWSIVACKKMMVGLVCQDDIRYMDNTNRMGMNYMAAAPFLSSIAESQGQQDFLFWNPDTANPQAKYFLS